MNMADHIMVVSRKAAYILMSRVTTSPSSIITVSVDSDTYLQSLLLAKGGGKYVIHLCRIDLLYCLIMVDVAVDIWWFSNRNSYKCSIFFMFIN